MSRPTQTVMLHRFPAVIYSALELSHLTYCRPQSQLFCLHFPSYRPCYTFNYALLHDTQYSFSWLQHWPVSPFRFSSLLGLIFLPLIFQDTSFPFNSAPSISSLGCCLSPIYLRLEHFVLKERNERKVFLTLQRLTLCSTIGKLTKYT